MGNKESHTGQEPARSKRDSLALSPWQDIRGFLAMHVGRLVLFAITCTSVIMVMLIFYFVVKEAFPFFFEKTGVSAAVMSFSGDDKEIDNDVIKFGQARPWAVSGKYDVCVTIKNGQITEAKIKRPGQEDYSEALISGHTISIVKAAEAGQDIKQAENELEVDIKVEAGDGLVADGSYNSWVTVKSVLIPFLTSGDYSPESRPAKYGVLAFIVGSLYVTIVAIVIAIPIGILAALFLSDIVGFKIRSVVKPVIELLAAIPSVAYGVFAILVLGPWMTAHLGFKTGANALNASLILSVMALPTIISVAEDSISATGRELREAAYGLGSTRFEAMIKVVIPAAHSGIIAAIVLGMMRAIGETMVVWMASGNASQVPHPWWDLSQSVGTMTAMIAGDLAETPKGSVHYRSLFAVGTLLLIFTIGLNVISEYFLSRAKKKTGKKS